MDNLSLYRRLKEIESPDATMVDDSPIVFTRGKGSHLWDADENCYVDLCAGFGALTLGHSHPRLKKVLESSTLHQGVGDLYASASKVDCLETLRSFLPEGFSRGALAVTGSQAVEMAIKTASLATGGSGVICFSQGYHGLDLGVLPIVGREDFRAPFKSLYKHDHVERLPFGCEEALLEMALLSFSKKKIKPSCVVVEPILGRGGVVSPPEAWLETVSSFCKKNKILFVLDEILTGSGRTGAFSKSLSVACDIICLGKAMGGGFPLSACFSKESIMKHWDRGQEESLHTGTFFGHPLMCQLSAETLKEVREKSLCERSVQVGDRIRALIQKEFSSYSGFLQAKGEGLLIGAEFEKPGFAFELMKALRFFGLHAIPCGPEARVLLMTPALNIEEALLEECVHKIKDCLKSL